jgi:hypothetical protein
MKVIRGCQARLLQALSTPPLRYNHISTYANPLLKLYILCCVCEGIHEGYSNSIRLLNHKRLESLGEKLYIELSNLFSICCNPTRRFNGHFQRCKRLRLFPRNP